MAKVQLEISEDTGLREFLDMCDNYNLDFKVISNYGADGNPLIEFTGDDDDIKDLISENNYDSEDEY